MDPFAFSISQSYDYMLLLLRVSKEPEQRWNWNSDKETWPIYKFGFIFVACIFSDKDKHITIVANNS